MYRRIKKIIIVPLLIVTLMSCIIYTDYRKPVQVEAAVLTGDPFVDIFSWALELVGFSPKNKENQAHALHEFSEWLVQQWKDNAAMLDTWMDADLKKKCDKWKAKLEKNWDSMSASEKYLEVRNIYTRKEYDQSGSSLSYSEWLDENYINKIPTEIWDFIMLPGIILRRQECATPTAIYIIRQIMLIMNLSILSRH